MTFVKCPKCSGDGYYEIGDVDFGTHIEASARSCELCQANGDAPGSSWYQGTGLIALPLSRAAYDWLWENGDEYMAELSYACACGDCFGCDPNWIDPDLAVALLMGVA